MEDAPAVCTSTFVRASLIQTPGADESRTVRLAVPSSEWTEPFGVVPPFGQPATSSSSPTNATVMRHASFGYPRSRFETMVVLAAEPAFETFTVRRKEDEPFVRYAKS